MKITREGMPEENDIVLANIVRITFHAAFVELVEYKGVEGLIHISEASKTWVKNLRTHFHENQKVVCKVLEVAKENFVHLSVRRVNDHDRRAKWDMIKRQKRIENLIEIIAKKVNKPFEDIYAKLIPFENKYRELYAAFEESKKVGKSFFNSLGELQDVVWDIVDKNISFPSVEISGVLKIVSTASDGIEKIKKMLENSGLGISYISAPRYRIVVKEADYKQAEKKLDNIINSIKKKAGKTETIEFIRDKKK